MKVRANQIQGMLRQWSDVETATKKAYESEGTAAKENEKYMNSMQGKIAATNAAWQALSNTILSSDILKGFIDTGQTILNIINDTVKNLGLIPPILTVIMGTLAAKKNFGRDKKLFLSSNMPKVVIVLFGYEQFRYCQC